MSEPAFTPTHAAPASGMDTWSEPDPNRQPDNRLDAELPVQLLEETTGWARVRCENGWETWVDACGLQPVTPSPTAMDGRFSPLVIWLPIAGAAIAILGGFLPWYSAGGESITAWDIPIVSLWTHDPSDFDLETGVALLLVILAGAPLLTGRPLPLLAAGAVAGVATNIGLLGFGLYFDLPEPRPDIGVGLILVLVGGIIMAAGPLLLFAQPRRQVAG